MSDLRFPTLFSSGFGYVGHLSRLWLSLRGDLTMLDSLISDYMLFLKIFLFFFLLRWLMEKLGNNKALFILALLIGTYYIFFARWSVLGAVIIILVLFVMGGIGNFMQDMIFQYDSLRAAEAEQMEAMQRPMTPMEMLRRY